MNTVTDTFWVQDAAPELAADIRQLRGRNGRFEAGHFSGGYMEIRFLTRIESIRQRWMLYARPLVTIDFFTTNGEPDHGESNHGEAIHGEPIHGGLIPGGPIGGHPLGGRPTEDCLPKAGPLTTVRQQGHAADRH